MYRFRTYLCSSLGPNFTNLDELHGGSYSQKFNTCLHAVLFQVLARSRFATLLRNSRRYTRFLHPTVLGIRSWPGVLRSVAAPNAEGFLQYGPALWRFAEVLLPVPGWRGLRHHHDLGLEPSALHSEWHDKTANLVEIFDVWFLFTWNVRNIPDWMCNLCETNPILLKSTRGLKDIFVNWETDVRFRSSSI